jgi:hypothetical protein
MSREARLKRLGLWHLKDDPKALRAELDRMLQEFEREDEEYYRQHPEKRPARAEPKPPSEKPEVIETPEGKRVRFPDGKTYRLTGPMATAGWIDPKHLRD